jgi:lipoprotein signal peptidase
MVPQKYLIALPVMGFVLCFDQLIKFMAGAKIPDNSHIALMAGYLHISSTQTPGLSFNFLANLAPTIQSILILGIPTAGIALAVLFLTRIESNDRVRAFSYSLVAASLLSNHLDRWRVGSVTDIFEFKPMGLSFLPTFNGADLIFLFGLSLSVALFLRSQGQPEE